MRILSHFWASDVYGVSDADAFDDAFDDVRARFFMACAYQNEDKIGDIIVDKVLFLCV
jgi:hypothetical protein